MAKGGKEEDFLQAVYVNGRDNVRTPIQWANAPNGGFSDVAPWIKVNPNYPEINVEAALADPNSIFYFYQKMLAFRKANPTLVYGDYKDLAPRDEQVFAYRRKDAAADFIIVHNFSATSIPVVRYLPDAKEYKIEISNYPNNDEVLKPWESRVYRRK